MHVCEIKIRNLVTGLNLSYGKLGAIIICWFDQEMVILQGQCFLKSIKSLILYQRSAGRVGIPYQLAVSISAGKQEEVAGTFW